MIKNRTGRVVAFALAAHFLATTAGTAFAAATVHPACISCAGRGD